MASAPELDPQTGRAAVAPQAEGAPYAIDATPLNDAGDTIETGRRLIRLSDERGSSLSERLLSSFYRLTWRTPLHALRLRGRFPLKLLAIPEDPISGRPIAGKALRAGHFLFRGLKLPVASADFARLNVPPPFADYIHSFAWLRDLASSGPREDVSPIAIELQKRWLEAHDESVTVPAWRGDNAGWRLMFWLAYAPWLMDTDDLVHRSKVLSSIARTARHLDRIADRERPGVPQLVAWAAVVAAGLALPNGEPRRSFGEAGLRRSLQNCFYADGGTVSRAPGMQTDAIAVLAMLQRCYAMRAMDPPAFIGEMLAQAVPALKAVQHGDGGLGSWQGSGATPPEMVEAVIAASGVRARPLRQARDWGYQRIAAGTALLQVDAAPPPVARTTDAGCASTLAFEFSDGPHRIIVNCGGAALAGALIPTDLARGLRSTAAHSTLVLGDRNSTAILADGTLGKGVTEVEIDRRETEAGSRLELSHDGYARQFGFRHRRLLILGKTGRELRGEDMLVPTGKRRRPGADFAIRFHLGQDIDASMAADGQGALLRISGGPLWQLRALGAALTIEDSLWVNGEGRPNPTFQLVLSGKTPPGGISIGWLLRLIG